MNDKMRDEPMPSLWHNGALNPDMWWPAATSVRGGSTAQVPSEGDLVGWRYGAWRVIEVRMTDDANVDDDHREYLLRQLAHTKPTHHPAVLRSEAARHIVLRHERGPKIVADVPHQVIHDGTVTIHFGHNPPRSRVALPILREPYQVCSCHGHVWPCQEMDQVTLAYHQSRTMDRLMAGAVPGVCAACLEPITPRQKTLTFPEPSRLVPGAPGPTFHAGRADCWREAEEYERTGRLSDDPDVERLASCPGVTFIHERHDLPADQRIECTAGPLCTGHHGPPGHRRDITCWTIVGLPGPGAYVQPGRDCGYRSGDRSCLGSLLPSAGNVISAIAGDVLWEQSTAGRRHRRNIESKG